MLNTSFDAGENTAVNFKSMLNFVLILNAKFCVNILLHIDEKFVNR